MEDKTVDSFQEVKPIAGMMVNLIQNNMRRNNNNIDEHLN